MCRLENCNGKRCKNEGKLFVDSSIVSFRIGSMTCPVNCCSLGIQKTDSCNEFKAFTVLTTLMCRVFRLVFTKKKKTLDFFPVHSILIQIDNSFWLFLSESNEIEIDSRFPIHFLSNFLRLCCYFRRLKSIFFFLFFRCR